MTEPRGRAARWSAAALVAPIAAGLFAGTTAWAGDHDPLTASASASPSTASTAAAVDPQVEALRKALAAQHAVLDRLTREVAAVRAQAAALHGTAASPARPGAGGTAARPPSGRTSSSRSTTSRTGGTGSTSTGTSSGSSGTTTRKPTTAPAPPPSSPPPTHTTTGASGVVK